MCLSSRLTVVEEEGRKEVEVGICVCTVHTDTFLYMQIYVHM